MKAEEEVQILIENINDAVFSLDHQGRFTYLSPVIERLISFRAEELIGQPIARLVHPEDLPKFLFFLKSSLNARYEPFEFRALDKEGDVKCLRASARPLMVGDQSVGLAGTLSDITTWKQIETQIRPSLFRDRLTGLYNRDYFEEEMKRLDTPRQLPLSMIFADVNCLKLINDVFGHSAGDKLLSTAADVIRHSCRKEDVIARLGGDEFGIFLPRTDPKETIRIMKRIKVACQTGDPFPVKVSIALGAVSKEDPSQNLHLLIREAEDRMYRDKLVEGKAIRTSVISSMREILYEKRDEPEDHVQRLKQQVLQVGFHLDLPGHLLDDLGLFAALHDIGKIVIPRKISQKTGSLSLEEWRIIRKHPEIGYRIAASCPELAGIAEAILSHHEWWNGAGYPRALEGEEIPLLSRILSVADAYDAMTHDRPGRFAMSEEKALDEIRRGVGTQFDPAIAETFVKILSEASEEYREDNRSVMSY